MKFFHRLRTQFRKQELDQELSDELAFHIEKETEENIAAGMSADEARYAALRRFGGVEQAKEECRDAWGVRFIDTLLQDLRFGLRMLAKNPGFTAVAVLTLALGIGANTAIFSVVNAVLFRPLPFKNAARLVVVWENNRKKGWDRHPVEGERFFEWVRQNRAFEEMAASNSLDLNFSGNGEAARIRVGIVTSNYFSLYGVQPMLGRTFLPSEHWQEGGRVVVLSQGFWERRFGTDPNILGRAITLEGESYTIVGVMPARFLSDEQAWIPLRLLTTQDYSFAHSLLVLARLKPGVTLAQAQADLSNIACRLEEQSPDDNAGWGGNGPRASG